MNTLISTKGKRVLPAPPYAKITLRLAAILLLKTDKAQPGDIIAFYYNNKVLVRRVICQGGRSIA